MLVAPDTSDVAPPSFRGDSTPPPVFVLCVARSCSTVTMAMLSGHPGTYAFPELLLFTGETVRDIAALRSGSTLEQNWRSGLPRTVAELWFGSQSADALQEAQKWIQSRYDWSREQLFATLLDKVAPRVGIEKSPDSAFSSQRLDACLNSFPDARFIHLVRHPVSNVRSLARHLRAMRAHQQRVDEASLDPAEVARSAADTWIETHRRILRFSESLPVGRTLMVNAEPLLTNPQAALPRILGWAGLATNREIIEAMCRTERWVFARTGPPAAPAGGDPNFLASPRLAGQPAPDSIEPPASWMLDDDTLEALTNVAGRCGYERP